MEGVIMKRSILAIILILGAVFCAYGQSSSPIDLVLVLDTSSGMSSSYERVNNYITGSFLSEFLRIGDTFHLITYSGNARIDIARRVAARGDVETIIGRMLIQYPVENGNNPTAAISFAENYINSLPSRPKKIVVVGTGSSDMNNAVSSARQRLSSRNVTIDFVQVSPGQPLANLPSSGRAPAARGGAAAGTAQTGTGSGAGTAAGGTGTAGGGIGSGSGQPSSSVAVTTPGSQTQRGSDPSSSTYTGTSGTGTTGAGTTGTGTTGAGGQGTASGTGFGTGTGTGTGPGGTGTGTGGSDPYSTTSGTGTTGTGTADDPYGYGDTSGTTSDSTSAYTSTQSQTAADKRRSQGESIISSMPTIIWIIIGLLLLLGLIIFLASRKLGSSPNRVMAAVSSSSSAASGADDRFADHSKDLASYAAAQSRQRVTPYSDKPFKPDPVKVQTINPTGPLLLNLFVEDQNTAIGKRNIHNLKSGYNLSVGGGKGDGFYIFLVPLPANLGEVRRNGSSLSFIPRKPKYFPDIGSNEVRDCLNKTIRIISDKGYELRFRFEMYEDPLIALNRILNSVKVPG
jgi:hypothetical protein